MGRVPQLHGPKLFRDTMANGDKAFFYHSSVDPAGIVGTMEILGDAYPDPTQFDPNSEYFDLKSPRENPRWVIRNVRLLEKYKRMVPLSELRAIPGLAEMFVLRKGQRLSVMPVTADEFKIIDALPGLR